MIGLQAEPSYSNASKDGDQGGTARLSPPGAVKKRAANKKGWIYVATAIAMATGCFWLWPGSHANVAATQGTPEATLVLETFVVNVGGASARSYLRVGVTLGLSRPPGKKEEAPVALVRDTVLAVLASAQPEELLAADGKQKLKERILRGLQERAPALGVENVYFTEFLVQT
ncbi:MAG: flagellar basal body-associated FliL family protein [Terriglobales bacterium]|jgi:flagellar basal body-associated protein FliL